MVIVRLIVAVLIVLTMVACGSQQPPAPSTGGVPKVGGTTVPATIDKQALVTETVQRASPTDYVPGELIVKFRADLKSSQTSAIHNAKGASLLKRLGVVDSGSIDLVRLPEGTDLKDAMRLYMADPSVEYAEPNYRRYLRSTIPNDTYFVRQWGLYNTGSMMNGTPGADIKAPLAWDFSRGSNSLVVAVIDTGVDYNHEDLYGKIWINNGEICTDGIDNDNNGYVDDCYGWNFVDRNNDPMDTDGHGTHVSGVIGAVTNNGLKIAGLLWDVKIMGLKFIGPNGGTTADAISALNYAVRMGAKIVNASYGSSTYSQAERDSIAAANQRGVLFIAAAGNDAENNDIAPSYPCSYGLPNIISVAATDQNDRIASFSSFGPSKVDVAAPGVYILSLIPNNGSGMNQDFWPGTSMATPHVVGTAGLILTNPEYVDLGFSIYQTRAFIEEYVDKLPSLEGKIRTGGRINAYKAVTAMLKPVNLTASTTGPTSVEPLRVNLKWQNRATGAENIRIERMQEGVDTHFVEIAQLSPDKDTYTDSAVSGEKTYHYRVRAFKGLSQSYVPTEERFIYTPYTNTVSVTTPVVPQSFGGGRGCSITPLPSQLDNGTIDVIIVMLPLMVVVFLIGRRLGSRPTGWSKVEYF